MNEAAIAGLAAVATAVLTQLVAPWLVKRKSGDFDYRQAELKAAVELRQQWKVELEQVRTENQKLKGRCDHLEEQQEQLERSLRREREYARALRKTLVAAGIEAPPRPSDER